MSSNYLSYNDRIDIYKTIRTYLQSTNHPEESIYFLDLGEIKRLYQLWQRRFPNVHPYYAIKCNPDHGFIQTLAELGANFDCASVAEIDKILSLGIGPDRIIFANPCKRKRDIVTAYERGIRKVTFDTETELEKIAAVCPQMQCILRIYAKDPAAKCQFAHKFGCPKERWQTILEQAYKLNMDIVGISFHVGSGASSPQAYALAIQEAAEFAEQASCYGHKIELLDIGGGFVSHDLKDIPEAIQEAIQTYFPNTTIIAEPGRFFAETSGYLATNVIGIRKTETTRDYWITDSLYGSFNCIFYDHYTPEAESLIHTPEKYKTTLYGPTCDGLDKILEVEAFPELQLNDWILFRRMGAYTLAGACNFNGIPFLNAHIVYLTN